MSEPSPGARPPPSTSTLAEIRLARRAESEKRELRAGVVLAAALVLAAVLAGGRLWRIATGEPPPTAGSPAPGFVAPDLEGKPLDLVSLKGRVVLLDFWATWCPPCVASIPGLQRMHRRFADRGFTVVGVNQEPEAEAQVRAFVAGRELSFPVVVDPGSIAAAYGVHTLPTSFLVDREGVIRGTWRGIASEAMLEAALESLLGEEPTPETAGER